MNVKYSGSWDDYSGVGDSNRADISSLYAAGVNLTTELLVQVPERTDHGLSGDIAKRFQNKKIPYKIKILHITPDLVPKFKEKGIYHIGRVAWETSKLPDIWVDGLNECNEVWTMSPKTAEVMKTSGVKVPIFVFPEAVDVFKSEEEIIPFKIHNPKDFLFYAMFQWIDRKNPKGLLRAYWKAFEGNYQVALLLKTYRVTFQDHEFELIKQEIESWKKELNLGHYPRIFLVKKLLTSDERFKLHKTGDCFISSSSGEGWNRPVEEAMLLGKSVISPSSGGILDMIDSNCYYEIPTTSQKVTQQTHIPWYTSDQDWNVLDEDKLSSTMQEVYKNQNKEKIDKAKNFVVENFNYQTVGLKMKERLEQIYGTL